MSHKIIDKPTFYPPPEVNFTWTPTTGYSGYSYGGNLYPPAGFTVDATPIGTPITFTATVQYQKPNTYAVRWDWDLGDGTKGQGTPISHTYRAAIESSTGETGRDATRAVVCVTDNWGSTFCVGKQLLLRTTIPLFARQDTIRALP
jgi:hypothetical protein